VRYFLDTTFAIDFLRSLPAAVERFEQMLTSGDEPFVNDVVTCELATGARPGEDAGLAAFLIAVDLVQPGPDVAAVAGRWRGEARSRGLTLSVPDALIAATTDALGAVLITRNVRDFAITPVQISTY
jgi:predicted nucleic acid-binding protein